VVLGIGNDALAQIRELIAVGDHGGDQLEETVLKIDLSPRRTRPRIPIPNASRRCWCRNALSRPMANVIDPGEQWHKPAKLSTPAPSTIEGRFLADAVGLALEGTPVMAVP
jgi:hypothetical protein